MNKAEKIRRWGPRLPMRDALDVLNEADAAYRSLQTPNKICFGDINQIKQAYSDISRTYYALAAASRRRHLDEPIRNKIYLTLFKFRSTLESCIRDSIMQSDDLLMIVKRIASKSFFGRSIKQGVSIRYPLSTCVPTSVCGGRCYAHDGRDRDYQRLFRGVLNGILGLYYEKNPLDREMILLFLNAEIERAINSARIEANDAAHSGYTRKPRIRFSHVGEMAATPLFTNRLAKEIHNRAPDVSCVIYTRHPNASHLDANVLVVNFTVDGEQDKRIDFFPPNSKLVNSSWDGRLLMSADINFLEHHVEKAFSAIGSGSICPVTLQHDITPSCDSAKCERCFVKK